MCFLYTIGGMNVVGELPSSLEVLRWQALLEVRSLWCNNSHQISQIAFRYTRICHWKDGRCWWTKGMAMVGIHTFFVDVLNTR